MGAANSFALTETRPIPKPSKRDRIINEIMRIESGYWRGQTLQAPNGNATRPTDGRTREMLFNSLGEFIVDARVLDLYAGSGAVGLEALSRGAKSCVFVELEHGALRALRANVKKLRVEGLCQIWAANARTAPAKLSEDRAQFDFIFADPPFAQPNEGAEIARRLDALPGLLNNEVVESRANQDKVPRASMIVVQHSRRVELPELEHFEVARLKKSGESTLTFLRPRADSDSTVPDAAS